MGGLPILSPPAVGWHLLALGLNYDTTGDVYICPGRKILTTSLPEGLLNQSEDHAYMLAVADGMGGRNFGDLASLLAMRTGWELGGDGACSRPSSWQRTARRPPAVAGIS